MVSEAALALLAAGEWGVSGFCSKLSADRNGPSATLVVAQTTGLALATAAVVVLGEGTWNPLVILPILAMGWLNVMGFWAHYRAFQRGKLAVVEPIVSTSPALTVLLAVLILREGLWPGAWLAVGGILIGILLLVLQPWTGRLSPRTLLAPGTALALVAFLTLGITTFLLKIVVPEAGPTFTILLLRLGGMVMLGPLVLLRRIPVPRPKPPRMVLLPLAVGALDTTGFVLFNLAILNGSLIVATVLSNLYVVVALVLAWRLLRERLRIHQLFGIGLAVVATVALVALLPG